MQSLKIERGTQYFIKMNNEDFVTYEQSLALKKLGFRENCIFYYNNRNSMRAFCVEFSIQYSPNNIGGCLNRRKDTDDETCDAPTLEQAQKWLRGKGIDITIYRSFSMKHSYHYELIKDMDYNNAKVQSCIPNRKYEEALSAGITECLKLLENGSKQ